MGFFGRIRSRRGDVEPPSPTVERVDAASSPPARVERVVITRPPSLRVEPVVLGGRDTLEVVGESFHQDHLWAVVGGRCVDRVRHATRAILTPEPENPYDRNAIKVMVDGGAVGHLSRDDAAEYLPGLKVLIEKHGRPVALGGCIVGGGERGDGIGMLGVFLDHDPGDFGIRQHRAAQIGELRTGLSQAIATDLEDDSYDLSWLDQLSGTDSVKDIVVLRRLLQTERDPIDRHFMLAELSKSLYRSRDAVASALDEFDEVCEQHHDEMALIRPALMAKFGCVPIVDIYRQAAIRCQKARDWQGAHDWAERGLLIYGTEAGRPEAVADLEKRMAHAAAKLSPPARQPRRQAAGEQAKSPVAAGGALELERLICAACGREFERPRTRGRKPHRCPDCRE